MNTEIRGTMRFKDYLKLELYHQRKGFLMMLFIAIIAVYVAVPNNSLTIGVFIVYYIYGSILGTIVVFLFTFIRIRRNYKTLNKRFHEKIVQIDKDGIQYGSKENQEMYQWSDIRKTVFFKKTMFLYISNNRAIVIPSHFFSSVAEEKEWNDFIKSHLLS